jgi:tagatose-6-phosphate ketose/aldose isomerase
VNQGSFTLREILQQPDLWPDSVERVRDGRVLPLLEEREILICGAGTSAYAAAAIAAGWPKAHAIPSTDLLLYSRKELLREVPGFAEQGAVISIARSGDSPESIGVVTRMQKMFPSVPHFAITCNADGALVKLAGVHSIVLDARTNDRSLAMTSSFSNLTVAGAALFNSSLLTKHLPQVIKTTRAIINKLEAAAGNLAAAKFTRVVVLSSADLRPLAAESSLKILEMTAGTTIAIPETFLGLRHGPMSFLRKDALVIGFLSSAPHKRRYEEDLLRELGQKNLGQLVVVGKSETLQDSGSATVPAIAPQLPDHLRVPFEAVFPQLLAYHLSLAFGFDPDNPSPSGVITRVVQRFRLHEESF